MPIPPGLRKKYSTNRVNNKTWAARVLEKSLESEITYEKGRIYASSIGDDARLLFLKFQGLVRDAVTPKSSKKMANGSLIHDRWAKDLAKAKILVVAEERVPPHPKFPQIGARLDFIVRWPLPDGDGKLYLIELKTTGSEIWKNKKEPDYGHLCQWTYYSDRRGIEQGWVVYEDAGETEDKWFYVERSGSDVRVWLGDKFVGEWLGLVDQIYEKLEYIISCEENNAIPEKCAACSVGKCKHPDLCNEAEKRTQVISFSEWKNRKVR